MVDLNGKWELAYGPQTAETPTTVEELKKSSWPRITASVPGNVELDLVAAGQLPQDLWRGNLIYQLRPLEYFRWWYRRTFRVQIENGCRAVLVFEGIDCLAEVFLNGKSVGRAANMLIEHEFDVTDSLQDGDNELCVRIDSAVLAGRQHRADAIEFAANANWESLAVRKAPHVYGWDILPRVVSAGLWRGVRLEMRPATRLEDVYWATIAADPATKSAEVLAAWHITTQVHDIDGWVVEVTLSRRGKVAHRGRHHVVGTQGRVRMRLSDVSLWWPRGSGESALYDGEIRLLDASGTVLANHRTSVGVRTVVLRKTELTGQGEQTGEFVFVVNGKKIYCRGTNHVPLDSLHSRDAKHLEALEMLCELNCNMIRCWGGNVYEDHSFFDFCDRSGILVWQDFALACAIYPQTSEFAEVIRHEAESVVKKLRNHPSLALWAGNNEIDQCYATDWSALKRDPNEDAISREVLPAVVRRLDPFRGYLPSSPYVSRELFRANDTHRRSPEDHLWGPRDDFKGQFYTTSNAHFVSEIGYHGCPDRASMEAMMDGDHLWPWQDNDQWVTHAVRPHPTDTSYTYRIELMAKQIRVLFDRDPDNLDDYIFASQASQAEAVKYFIERWRMRKWRTTGMLWWNLRDGWPVISDAVVDYFGRKKLAYECIRRVQADVCVCVEEPADGVHRVLAVNDTFQDATLEVAIRDLDSGRVLLQRKATASADCVTPIGTIPVAPTAQMWGIDAGTNRNHYLAGPRPFRLADYRRWAASLNLASR